MGGGDGMQVPKTQIVSYLQALGERRLADAIDVNDIDGDGKIHAGEFIAALSTMRHSDGREVVKTEAETSVRRIVGFVSVDENGDGLLDENEFLRYLTSMTLRRVTEADARDILKQFDTDGNGHIDYLELMKLHDSGLIEQLNNYQKVTAWDKDLASSLKDVPCRDIVEALRVHLKQNGCEARVLKTESQLIVKLLSVSSTGHNRIQLLTGAWDPLTMRPIDEGPRAGRRPSDSVAAGRRAPAARSRPGARSALS